MIVPLIPLFLAASIGVNESEVAVKDTWRYGAEAIYELSVERVRHLSDDRVAFWVTSGYIACRPKSSASLSCRFYDGSYSKLIQGEKSPEKYQRLEHGPEEELFELNFRRDGLKEIVVSSLQEHSILDILRVSVGQLNVGVDVYKYEKSEFETTENFTTGVCQTDYVLSTRNASNEDETDTLYEMLMLRNKIPVKDGVMMEMRRTRNVDACHPRIDYFFGSRARAREVDMKIESSKSEMLIGRRNFTSWTDNTVIVSNQFNTNAYVLKEKITLTLMDIVPAVGRLPTLTEPTLTASIFPGSFLSPEMATIKESSSEEEISSSDEYNDLS